MHGNKLTHGEYEVEPPRLVDAQVHAVRHAAHLRRELAIQIAAASEIRASGRRWAPGHEPAWPFVGGREH